MAHISIPTVRSDVYVTENIGAVISLMPAILKEGLRRLILEEPSLTMLQGIAEALRNTIVGENAGLRRKTDCFPNHQDSFILGEISKSEFLKEKVPIRIRNDNLSQSIIANYISLYYHIPINSILIDGVFNEEILNNYLRDYMEKDKNLFDQSKKSLPTVGVRQALSPTGLQNTDHVTPEFLKNSARVAQWTLQNQKNTKKNPKKKPLAAELEAFLQM